MVLVINKVDRPDARIDEVVDEVYELFLDLDADEHQIDFPIVYSNARAGRAWLSVDEIGEMGDLEPLFATIIDAHPGARLRRATTRSRRWSPTSTPRPTSAAWPSAASTTASIKKGQQVAWCRKDGTIEQVKITEMYVTETLERVAAEEAGPGEIIAIAGMAEITIGETLADLDDPRPLPVTHVDEPSLSMTIGINTSPVAGQEGKKLTARMIKDRLDAELVGNVSIAVLPTERPDTWEVQGRGELQLAVLVETMRREGFELTVGKPQVVTREIDGKVHEPVERVSHRRARGVPRGGDPAGGPAQGPLEQMVNHGTGWVRMDYRVPARGLIGFRTEFLTETRGTGHPAPHLRRLGAVVRRHPDPPDGEPGGRPHRARRPATPSSTSRSAGCCSSARRPRSTRAWSSGENARSEEMDVNPTKEKKLTNHRASSADSYERLIPAPAAVAGAGAGVHPRRRVRRGHPARRCGCARWSSTRRSEGPVPQVRRSGLGRRRQLTRSAR